MYVPSRGEQLRIDVGRVERRNRAGEREDGAIARAAGVHSDPGSQARIDDDPRFTLRVAIGYPPLPEEARMLTEQTATRRSTRSSRLRARRRCSR